MNSFCIIMSRDISGLAFGFMDHILQDSSHTLLSLNREIFVRENFPLYGINTTYCGSASTVGRLDVCF